MAKSGRKVPSTPARHQTARGLVRMSGVLVAVTAGVLGLWMARHWGGHAGPATPDGRSRTGRAAQAFPEDERKVFAEYGGSASCQECHEEAYELWKTSNHALAERAIQPE